MRKNQVKLMVAGMLVMVLMTGCGSSDNNADSGSNSIISTDMEDAGHNAEEQESLADTETAQMGESSQPQSQSQVAESIEEELAAYRAEREKGVSSSGGYTMVELPNEENYQYGVGDSSGYTSRFDSKELNEAFKVAGTYVEGTLNLESEVWVCIDPMKIKGLQVDMMRTIYSFVNLTIMETGNI